MDIDIPTEDELSKLPRWAVVAFAARCGRLVLSEFQRRGEEVPEHLHTLWAQIIEDAETAAAKTAYPELDVSDYVLGLVGYQSPFGCSYHHYFSRRTSELTRAAKDAEEPAMNALMAAAATAKAAHYATWAKAADEWSTYGSNAAMIKLDRVRKNDSECVEYAHEAMNHAIAFGIPACSMREHFDALFCISRREDWHNDTSVPADFFSD